METGSTNASNHVPTPPNFPIAPKEPEEKKETPSSKNEELWKKVKERFEKALEDLNKKPPSASSPTQ